MSLRGDGQKRLDRQRAIVERIQAAEAEIRQPARPNDGATDTPEPETVPSDGGNAPAAPLPKRERA